MPEPDYHDNTRSHRLLIFQLLLENANQSEELKLYLENELRDLGGPIKSFQQTTWEELSFEIQNLPNVDEKKNIWVAEFKYVSDAHKAYNNLQDFSGVQAWLSNSNKRSNNDKPTVEFRITNILLSVGFVVVIVVSIISSVLAFQSNLFEVSLVFAILKHLLYFKKFIKSLIFIVALIVGGTKWWHILI